MKALRKFLLLLGDFDPSVGQFRSFGNEGRDAHAFAQHREAHDEIETSKAAPRKTGSAAALFAFVL